MCAAPLRDEQNQKQLLLLELTQQLMQELHPHDPRIRSLHLDSSFEKDLRLDSLSQVELISRLEQYFNVALPQNVFVDAQTPRDLLRALDSAQDRQQSHLEIKHVKQQASAQLPYAAGTLVEVLQWHVKQHPDRLHIRILDDEQQQENTLTYAELWQGAQLIASGLQYRGVQSGDTVAIMLPSGRDYFDSFFGVLLCGAIPVPIYPPSRPSQLEDHLHRHSGILANSRAKLLITIPGAKTVARLLKSQVASLQALLTTRELATENGVYQAPRISPYDIAFLQYTSGSTGNPKGVVLTHKNLVTNIRAMGEAVLADSQDVFVSWLPLYHDMGLIAAWLGSLYFSMEFVVMSPLSFLTRPQRWLWAIHNYHGTLSASPNFGYELCLKRISDQQLQGLDLSSWRLAFNGAEPVSPHTIKRFTERFKPYGVRPETIMPVYGLAESSVGLAFPPPQRKPVIDCVQREVFARRGEALRATADDDNALCFVACGQPLAGHEVCIVDNDGRELPERQQGVLEFRGPSSTTGYFHNSRESAGLFNNGWLGSGDLAYVAKGEIYITGRVKDIIIRGGRNIYPHELEEAVGNIDHVRKGCVVAFGVTDPRSGTERMVVLVETRLQGDEQKEQLRRKIIPVASELIGSPPDEVLLLPPHTILKTSSGKVRRSACRELYEQGQLHQATRAVWLQVVRMLWHSLLPQWRRLVTWGQSSIYAVYSWLVFALLASVGWLAVLALPRLGWRWRVLHKLARLLAVACSVHIKVDGLDMLPVREQTCVYVVNHASYIDALVLTAVMPRPLAYVAKSELRGNLFARLALLRLGAEFVDRHDKSRGGVDIQRFVAMSQRQQSLVFFPEGTIARMPGLMDFHMGAFITAVQADVPVVPIAIRGARSVLRSDSWFPRRGRISVTIGQPLDKSSLPVTGDIQAGQLDDWRRAVKLRDVSREHILRYCGEPALSR